jgi:hypothetical protein
MVAKKNLVQVTIEEEVLEISSLSYVCMGCYLYLAAKRKIGLIPTPVVLIVKSPGMSICCDN